MHTQETACTFPGTHTLFSKYYYSHTHSSQNIYGLQSYGCFSALPSGSNAGDVACCCRCPAAASSQHALLQPTLCPCATPINQLSIFCYETCLDDARASCHHEICCFIVTLQPAPWAITCLFPPIQCCARSHAASAAAAAASLFSHSTRYLLFNLALLPVGVMTSHWVYHSVHL
jgi:hypothetical protein